MNIIQKGTRAGVVAFSCVGLALGLAACSGEGSEQAGGESAAASSASPSDQGVAAEGAVSITDVAGRTVDFDKRPARILLGEGRALLATSVLDKDNPAEGVVAIGTDLHAAAPGFEKNLIAAHKEVGELPTVGNIAKGDVTVENLLSYKPDVVVMTLDHKKSGEESGFIKKMDEAGIKYVFTDFRQKPLENTTKSMTVFGELFGDEDKAEEFNKFYNDKLEDIKSRAAKTAEKPDTFLWRAAGLQDCCSTVAESNLGELVTAAGGSNLGDTLLDGDSGQVTAEKVVAEQPKTIIATGGMWAKDPAKPDVVPHAEIGYGSNEKTAESTLHGLLETPGFEALTAPSEGGFHGVYHQFYDSPFNIFALEAFAQWIHPEEFSDLDAQKDFADFHKEWLPFDMDGVFFVTDTLAKK